MEPLALAAEIHLCVLRNGIQGEGAGMDLLHHTNREIRRSLEVICRAMETFQQDTAATGKFGSRIAECRAFLQESEQQDRWFSGGV